MKAISLVALGVVAMAGVVLAYDLPEVILRLQGERGLEFEDFATDFCWVADQNGDGCDELLVNRDPFQTGYSHHVFANRVELYYGGDPMDDAPAFTFTTDDTTVGLGYRMLYLGNIDNSGNPYVAIGTLLYESKTDPHPIPDIRLYEIGNNIDNDYDYRISLENDVVHAYNIVMNIGSGRMNRPCDLNGDGYNDLIVAAGSVDTTTWLLGFFGGEEFDTIPDWKLRSDSGFWYGGNYSSGFDINADGCDDFLIGYWSTEMTYWYSLFLGGDPMDTMPLFKFEFNCFEDTALYGFTLLPDINGDGYDDFAFHYYHIPSGQYYDDGTLVFFGSEHPDLEPDLDLEGNHSNWEPEGEVAGGDVNGDGLGDIITGALGAYQGEGEVHVYLGSRWMSKAPEIVINGDRDYNAHNMGELVGAVGDYNGDGVGDFVVEAPHWISGHMNDLLILEGNANWRVGVPGSEPPKEYSLSLTTSPNPFNNVVSIDYQIPASGQVRLGIYDLAGREISVLADQWFEADRSGSASWSSPSSGIFIANLQWTDSAGKTRIASRKVVCVK